MKMLQLKNRRAMTLVEVLVAVSLFTTVGLLALTIFINIIRIQGRIALENAIYEDARFMMERMTRAVRNNALDYEEYFNKSVSLNNEYGELFGCYAAQFYNPGKGTHRGAGVGANPGSLGAICNDGKLYNGQECVVYKPSIDINTGQYPYFGSGVYDNSNAFCPIFLFGSTCTPAITNTRSELYLIDVDGGTKTIFSRKKLNSNPEYALAMVEKTGQDSNNDDIKETWNYCDATTDKFCLATDYTQGTLTSLEQSLSDTSIDTYTGFIPISPLRSNVTKLEFQITPSEDPRKAFGEPLAAIQPMVRISMSVQPSASQLSKFGNPTGADIPTIVLQTTVSSRIQSEIKSYLGPDTYDLTASGILQCNLADNP